MSKIKPDLVWYPPFFPKQGRLPTDSGAVGLNCKQQDSHELAYRNELCQAAGKLVEPPCCKTLHISLFFDGTGNNLNNDLYLSNPVHPTNIARLFRATIGQGYAGGVQKHGSELVDLAGTSNNKYYKYYIPGVGTPFPEVSDLDYSTPGLAFATYGEERINWGLLRIIDALRRTSGLTEISDAECNSAVKSMTPYMGEGGGSYKRKKIFNQFLNASDLAPKLKQAVEQPEPGKPKLLGIKLYVYGFSRGAATARAFVNWLSELLPHSGKKGGKPELCLKSGGAKIPLSIEFLGLLDTVASVGVANIAPFAEGHMGWADGAMELPDNGLIKKCIHLVSAHEQRLCFPLDSICRSDGTYPGYATEVVYPGMHSDIGGGYPPGDQGKAVGSNDSNLLSQIVLHEIYTSAFQAGAPFKIPEDALPKILSSENWRIMPADLISEFRVSESLVARFNAWRELTIGLSSGSSDIDTHQYNPVRASSNVITALENQMGWITAWRIGRYTNGAYKEQGFYKNSALNGQNKDSDPATFEASKKAREDKQKAVEAERFKLNIAKKFTDGSYIPLPPGPKDFDPAIAQVQLKQAAEEFNADYHLKPRPKTGNWVYTIIQPLSNTMYSFSENDFFAEYNSIRRSGEHKFNQLFPKQSGEDSAQSMGSLVTSLFDEQIHDSRAWFMQATFGDREPWGSYFLYRMIYFGELMSKNVSLIAKSGRFVGGQLKSYIKGGSLIFDNTEIINRISDGISSGVKQLISIAPASSSVPEVVSVDKNIQPAMTDGIAASGSQTRKVVDAAKLAETKADILSMW